MNEVTSGQCLLKLLLMGPDESQSRNVRGQDWPVQRASFRSLGRGEGCGLGRSDFPPPRASLGSGHLSASWQPQSGPSTPSPVAAQFTSEGATLSGLDLELLGGGYRMSLVKRRFATGSCSD